MGERKNPKPWDFIKNAAEQRDAAIVRYLTTKSVSARAAAIFNASSADYVLAQSSRIKKAFNAMSGKADEIVNKEFVKKLYIRSLTQSLYSAATQIAQRAKAYSSWEKAKDKNDFSLLEKPLQAILDKQRLEGKEKAHLMGRPSAFDVRLDRFTPGLKANHVEAWKAQLLLHKDLLRDEGKSKKKPKDLPEISEDARNRVLRRILRDFGINKSNCDLHFGEHPMCFSAYGRPQIILSEKPGDLIQDILTHVHEAGHALYRLHMTETTRESLLGMVETHYAGVDESMAMILEHHVARKPEFATYLAKVFKEEAGDDPIASADASDIYDHLNAYSPKMRRSDAMLPQYGLHLIKLFDLEKAMFEGGVNAHNLEQAWQERDKFYFDVETPKDKSAENVLQDPFWAMGEIGRFSGAYLPGMLMGAQFYEAMIAKNPNTLKDVERGNFAGIVYWCKENVYKKPRTENYLDLVQEVTGRALDTRSFLRQALPNLKRPASKPKNAPSQKPK